MKGQGRLCLARSSIQSQGSTVGGEQMGTCNGRGPAKENPTRVSEAGKSVGLPKPTFYFIFSGLKNVDVAQDMGLFHLLPPHPICRSQRHSSPLFSSCGYRLSTPFHRMKDGSGIVPVKHRARRVRDILYPAANVFRLGPYRTVRTRGHEDGRLDLILDRVPSQ